MKSILLNAHNLPEAETSMLSSLLPHEHREPSTSHTVQWTELNVYHSSLLWVLERTEIHSKTTFTRRVWHPFCRRSFLAFSLPVSHPGGANWWLIPYKIYLWCAPHHGKIGFLHLPKRSDTKENTLVGSSPSNAKRQSLHWTFSVPAHCQVTTHSLAGHLLQKQ